MQGRLTDAARAMGGRLIGLDGRWEGAVIDSRKVEGGELFFALPGEHTDGHAFVGAALEAGAAAAVVSGAVERAGRQIEVADPYGALHALTRTARRRAPRQLVAITGSAGKTTTKELLAAMLEQRFAVGRSLGNFNNLLGFPLSLLAIDEEADWMVAEMGMSTPGELAAISRLGRPDIAVFTNVRAAHLEAFGSLRAIARAKAELLEGLDPDGLMVANADDPEVMWISERHNGPLATYGIDRQDVDLAARDLQPLAPTGSAFELVWRGATARIELPLLGRHNVENCLAAAAAALVAGVTLEEIAEAVRGLRPAAGRGEFHTTSSGAIVIDDSYNSNPSAVERALEAAAQIEGERHWAVLGDMLELGEAQSRFHREAGYLAVESGFDRVYGVGELSGELVTAAGQHGAETGWWADAAAAARELPRPGAGDVVLVKGSRGIGLEAVVQALLGKGD